MASQLDASHSSLAPRGHAPGLPRLSAGSGFDVLVGVSKLLHSAAALATEMDAKAITAGVMGATDAFLFGVVLIIFAYAIAFGFVLDVPREWSQRMPTWMRVNSIGELKHTLFGVILVYLIVDFATDIAASETHLTWQTLVIPLSIFLIAGTLRLLDGAHPGPMHDSPPEAHPRQADMAQP